MNSRELKKALLLSLLMPGLGQVYNGEVSKGISLFLLFAFSIPVTAWVAIHGPVLLLWLFVVVGVLFALGIYAVSCIDAAKRARAIGAHFQPGPYNKSYVYLSLFFIGLCFLNQLVTATETHITGLYQVASSSMSPTLLKGDHFFVDKAVNAPGTGRSIKRGDIALFIYPNDRTAIYVKRVIGLPGDKIELSGTEVKVNGNSILSSVSAQKGAGEPQIVSEKADSGDTYEVAYKAGGKGLSGSYTVAPGQVFVMGDNRDDSYDSRTFGTLPLADVIGIAKQVWFSTADSGLRIGKSVVVN